MIVLSVKDSTADILRQLAVQKGQMPFAAALALTRTAGLVKDAERKDMIDVFDRPTPWTLNSLYVKPATESDLRAFVWLKDERAVSTGTPADKYLTPEIQGGARSLKPFELAFRSAGILPSSHFMVPGAAAKIDQYGNMAKGQIVQLLSYFKAFPEQGYKANLTAAGKAKLRKGTKTRQGFEYFVGQPANGRLPLGIWQRVYFAMGTALKPIIIFVDSAHYAAIFDFGFTAQITVEREFAGQLRQATQEALASAHA